MSTITFPIVCKSDEDIPSVMLNLEAIVKKGRILPKGVTFDMLRPYRVTYVHPLWIEPLMDANINNIMLGVHACEYINSLKLSPPSIDILRVFSMDPTKIKVVLIGQDPYPLTYKLKGDPVEYTDAIGYSFATKNPKGSASLKNIYNELTLEGFPVINPNDYSLSGWIEQGVFLLNFCLVYYRSGTKVEPAIEVPWWKLFTKNIIQSIEKFNPHTKFLLMGSFAQSLMKNGYIKREQSCVTCGHPSSRNVGDTTSFIGSGCFNMVNHILGNDCIKWQQNVSEAEMRTLQTHVHHDHQQSEQP